MKFEYFAPRKLSIFLSVRSSMGRASVSAARKPVVRIRVAANNVQLKNFPNRPNYKSVSSFDNAHEHSHLNEPEKYWIEFISRAEK